MENIQEAVMGLLITIIVAFIGLIGTYATILINKITENIKTKTTQIENESQKVLVENALNRVNELVNVNVIKAQETLVKEILEKSKDGIFDKEDLKSVAVVVKNDVIKQMSIQVAELVKVEIDDLESYVSAVIEKTLVEVKSKK